MASATTTITSSDLEFARNFLVQYLRDAGFDGSLEDGTALNDLLIKAQSYYYTLYKAETKKVAAYLSLTKAAQYKDLLDDEYDTAVDSILANWFVTRKEGVATVGRIRLYFHQPQDFLQFPADTTLAVIEGHDMVPLVDTVVSGDDFEVIVNSVDNTTRYYVDVTVKSVEATDATFTTAQKVTAYVSNIYYQNAEIVEDFIPGYSKESSEDFIARTQKVITTRELITYRAIETVLLDTFTAITALYVAGYGDPEQMRDVKSFEAVEVHVGNKADIYVCAGLQKLSYVAQVDADYKAVLEVEDAAAILYVVSAQTPGEETSDFVPEPVYYVLSDFAENRYNGVGTHNKLYLPQAEVGDYVKIGYLRNDTIVDVDNLVRHPDQAVACYDPLVKSMFPVILSMDIRVKLDVPFGKTEGEVLAAIKNSIITFVQELPHTESVIISEVIGRIHADVSEVTQVELPLTIHSLLRDPATGEDIAFDFGDRYQIPDWLSNQVTWNTISFYTDESLIGLQVIG